MIHNDMHVHSIRSMCGLHTILEIAQIAINKGMRRVNISDHGNALRSEIVFGVVTDKRRLPNPVTLPDGSSIILLRGIEANILDIEGTTDIPEKQISKFDLINAGFHYCGLPQNGSEADNTKALINTLKKNPIDLLTHPCISTYPLHLSTLIDLAEEYGFALEINNTNLRLGKTNTDNLKKMIAAAIERNIPLIETSDGHTYYEIGENEKVEEFLQSLGLNGDDFLINRDDGKLNQFIEERIAKRQ